MAPEVSTPTSSILTPEQVQQHLQISRATLYRYLKVGIIPSFRLGKLIRVRASSIEALASSPKR